MRRVEDLRPDELADIVSQVQGVLWRDADAAHESWNPEKVWDAEAVEAVADVLASHGLRPDDTSWTGAEVKSCCRLAALLDVPLTQAAHNVVQVAVTASERVEGLRSWASGRCLSASAPGVYRRDGEPPVKPGRRVQRGGSNN